MADARFHTNLGPFTASYLATKLGLTLSDPAMADRLLLDVASLSEATAEHLSFFDNPKYAAQFAASKAGACIVHPKHAEKAPEGMLCLFSQAPYDSYAKAATLFYPPETPQSFYTDETAVIDAHATIGRDCIIHPNAVIEAYAEIGARCVIHPNAVIRRHVKIGDDCIIHPNVTISHALIGNRVVIFPNASIGQDGFGFATHQGVHTSVPQLGRVIIEDDVQIGANTSIDRGAGPDTVIGRGTRLDNLVQIGHNVRIGKGCIIVAQAGISGSTVLGDYVVVAGQVGISGHLTIGSGAVIAAKSGVGQDVPAGAKMMGYPAVPVTQFHRQCFTLQNLVKQKALSTHSPEEKE